MNEHLDEQLRYFSSRIDSARARAVLIRTIDDSTREHLASVARDLQRLLVEIGAVARCDHPGCGGTITETVCNRCFSR